MMDSMTSAREAIGRLDVTIAVAFGLIALPLTLEAVGEPVDSSLLGIVLIVPLTVPLLWRRAAPVGALGAMLAAVVALDLLFGSDVVRCLLVPPMTFLLVFSAGVRLERRQALIGLGLGLVLIVAEGISTYSGFAVVLVPLATAIWGIGRVVRSRRQMTDELERRTAELREARDERARLEVATERARLSGELDELLQRRLGELARMADDGARPSDPTTASAVLADIERRSRSTLDEMRAVVGVLRSDGSDLPTEPQPTLTHLEGLLVRAKGTDARLTVEGNPHVLPPGIELSAYRIVENLLSALEDAPGVDVRVCFGDDALELAVSGPARRRANDAIARARERVELHHGTLEARTRGRRAEAVVSLPLLARS
jgi:signal transduction histidine kinase